MFGLGQDITFCTNKDCPKKQSCHRSVETGLRSRFFSASDFGEVCIKEGYSYFIPEEDYQQTAEG